MAKNQKTPLVRCGADGLVWFSDLRIVERIASSTADEIRIHFKPYRLAGKVEFVSWICYRHGMPATAVRLLTDLVGRIISVDDEVLYDGKDTRDFHEVEHSAVAIRLAALADTILREHGFPELATNEAETLFDYRLTFLDLYYESMPYGAHPCGVLGLQNGSIKK